MLAMADALVQTFEDLFSFLRETGYAWEPQTPDHLVKWRRTPQPFDSVARYFGLGLPIQEAELVAEGMPDELIRRVQSLRPSISLQGNYYIAHSHWPAPAQDPAAYVHFGQESKRLLAMIEEDLESICGASILDLGCGSGALSFGLSAVASRVLGIDSSARAIEWADAAARAQRIANTRFAHAAIGTPRADAAVAEGTWDIAVSNPPMALPTGEYFQPHRDGGPTGTELPHLFLEFARRHLRKHGCAYLLATNPIVHGKPLFLEKLDTRLWRIARKVCLHERFNQSLYHKERYRDLGIERIELLFLKLEKQA
jgi:SAM-dependent methyltransferase